MNKALQYVGLGLLAFTLGGAGGDGCSSSDAQPSNKTTQSRIAEDAANSIHFNGNAEIDNIKKRLELTSDVGLLGYIVLLNQMGQPVVYEGVKGKVSSSTKRLTAPDRVTSHNYGTVYNWTVRQSPADDGTWGASDQYVFYWNTSGVYRQWSGLYLYSDQPIRLSQPPLVVTNDNK